MHMADALISPAVGATMLVTTAGVGTYAIKKIQNDLDEKKIPLMGVMGAFVFAAQMINFTIPGTGSSGHIGGGILLAILLGPYAGFLTMASILLIQALIFGDGGLLAFGCNVFNLGFYTCFIAYPFIFKKIVQKRFTTGRILTAAILSSVIGLQLGAFSVVIQTYLSGITELPFKTFLLLMQPIHLVIGIIEGVVTASVVAFVWKARPEIIERTTKNEAIGSISAKKVIVVMAIATLLTGGILSWFASSNPDGLEWSTFKASGKEEIENSSPIHEVLANVQSKLAILPDYGFKQAENEGAVEEESWPALSTGTSFSGVIGGVFTLALAVLTGFIITFFKKRKKQYSNT